MALEVKNILGLKKLNTLSDAGYATRDQFGLYKGVGKKTYCFPVPNTSPRKNGIPKSEFKYDKEKDYSMCQARE